MSRCVRMFESEQRSPGQSKQAAVMDCQSEKKQNCAFFFCLQTKWERQRESREMLYKAFRIHYGVLLSPEAEGNKVNLCVCVRRSRVIPFMSLRGN